MLKRILIKNIALIPELEIELHDGLNVLSGETGAGKSIIVDSLNFVLGIKTDKTIVRHGEKQAFVEAVFETTPDCIPVMTELGIEQDEITIINRTITTEGRSDTKINGRTVSLSMLRKITALLVDIHGQHEHQAILKPSNHIIILDGFNPEIAMQKATILSLYNSYKNYLKELADMGGSDADRTRAADLLKYQIDEITGAKLNPLEEVDLKEKRARLINLSRITTAVQSAENYLISNAAYGIPEALSLAENTLRTISEYEKNIPALCERLKSTRIEINDIIDCITNISEGLEFDSGDADDIESRLNLYKSLCRKYGKDVESVLIFCDTASAELDKLNNSEEYIARLKTQILSVENKLFSECQKLSSIRKTTAEILKTKIVNELSELGMNTAIDIVFNNYERNNFAEFLSSQGADTAEFFFSANKGEPLKPLAKIISGGEMSRFMLAIKNIIADTDSISTMVFDEIDTGISGKIGQVVAVKLAKIASKHQVICVTHLAQIASMADAHYLISKHENDSKTITTITLLDKTGEYEEISRLSGGKDISSLSVEHAKELKNWSDNIKKQF